MYVVVEDSYYLNFSEHAKELGNAVPTEPILFLKPTTSYITKGSKIMVSIFNWCSVRCDFRHLEH